MLITFHDCSKIEGPAFHSKAGSAPEDSRAARFNVASLKRFVKFVDNEDGSVCFQWMRQSGKDKNEEYGLKFADRGMADEFDPPRYRRRITEECE